MLLNTERGKKCLQSPGIVLKNKKLCVLNKKLMT